MSGRNNSFSLLHKRLQHYIISYLKWKKLNEIQEETIPIILNGNDSLIISPTASGKTEAALIPIFSELLNEFDHGDHIDHITSINVLYISPLKALLNDMDRRISKWADYLGFTVTKWHGDVPRSRKNSFIKDPTDFLLITPESLEVILMMRTESEKERIFKNMKYIIVDEIHYFADSDRGVQLNSLLNRISKYGIKTHITKPHVIRIGLSATVENPKLVAKWLNHEKDVSIIENKSKRDLKYKVIPFKDTNTFDSLNKYSNDKKLLLFSRSRAGAENYTKLIKKSLNPHNLFLHHSSLDKKIRENNEKEFKESKHGMMISTSTLELGIDIGDIFATVHILPPNNVSSFLQRIGRSGRESKLQRSIIFCKNDTDVFITLAELSLIKEERLENIKIPRKSKDIYFHQILSVIFQYKKILKKEVYFKLKDSFVFSEISSEEYRKLIEHMENQEFIVNRNKYLSLGPTFEEKFGKNNFKNFFTVFCPNYEYRIVKGQMTIGTIDPTFALTLCEGTSFILGGKHWKVVKIDYTKFKIHVKDDISKKGDIPGWNGDGAVINYTIARRIYDIVLGNFDNKLLKSKGSVVDESFVDLIYEYIDHGSSVGFKKGIIPLEFDDHEGRVYIYTFAGDKANALLSMVMKYTLNVFSVRDTPFYSSFKLKETNSLNDVLESMYDLKNIIKTKNFKIFVNEDLGKFYKNKFVNFIPEDDNINLKMDIIYDIENIITLIEDNKVEIINETKFKNWK
ncbi:DEAD/DEAH box helicase [Methanobrevibacter filiformis]|uniref:Putative DEAD-box ATP-dependent RNA helicase n=1 Tax=Methanobrevibacter filiformis TaxID=55758 RepID=A0A166CPS4_9EURY|nr:DEAD/DEAH box helicase [Methanobrevibacter filiformis]KZX14739.1 putative DEAD-box ATP-dependent RNA helicase [Methanobrevibacter filiformis]